MGPSLSILTKVLCTDRFLEQDSHCLSFVLTEVSACQTSTDHFLPTVRQMIQVKLSDYRSEIML